MIKKLLLTVFLVLSSITVLSQSLGDYRSNTSSGLWSALSSWQYYNGSFWVAPSGTSPQGFPGQFTGTGSVLIQAGNTITIGDTGISTQTMGTVTINGTLILTGKNSSQVEFSLLTNSIIVSSGATIKFIDKVKLSLPVNASLLTSTGGLTGDCSNNQDIYIGLSIYAVCTGGGGILNFSQVMTSGGTLNTIISTNSPLCENGTINFSGAISNTGWTIVSYLWSITPPSGSPITASTQNVSVANALSGNYMASLTVTAKYGSSSDYTNMKTVNVVVNSKPPTPTITAVGSTTFCSGGSVTLTSTVGTSYLWSTGATTQSINPTSAGSYTVQVTNSSGCQSALSSATVVTVNALPNNVVNGFSATTICTGGSPQLTFDADDTTYSTPYSITYKNDITSIQYTVSVTSKDNFSFIPGGNPTSNAGYTLISISNATCTNSLVSSFGDSGANLIVRPMPTATISGATSVCVGAAPPNVTFTNPQTVGLTVTYTINNGGLQTVDIVAKSGTVSGTTNVPVATSAAGTFVYNLVSATYQSTAFCSNAISGSATVTVNPNLPASVSIAALPLGAICSGTSVTFTATPTNGGTTPAYQWKLNGGNVGINSVTFTNASLSNSDVVTCVMTTIASSCITGSPATSNIVTMTVPDAAIWNGSVWTNGPPASTKALVFNGTYTSSGDMEACSCQVNSGVVTINSGHTLKITDGVTVSGGASLTFENTSSLVQINDVPNSGVITYKRSIIGITNNDYTYWSSPVKNQTLFNVSPNTISSNFYSFDPVADDWKRESTAAIMSAGIGYIISGPEFFAPNPPGFHVAPFRGEPHNGTVNIPVNTTIESSYLLGNPYPSALDADSFIVANNAVLDGTLYFWTHNTAIQLRDNIAPGTAGSGAYAYTSNDYASYNLTGGVGVGTSAKSDPGHPTDPTDPDLGLIPSGKIGSGQGFFVTSKAGGNIVFNNNMRVGVGSITGNNSQFFKTVSNSKTGSEIEKHRLWLNLTNSQGAFKQTLIGYITGATNGYDHTYDGESFDGNEFIDFYTVNEDKNLVIQGRALPFDETDTINLGYSSTIEGSFFIDIDQVDGLLMDQEIFLEDKKLDIIHNLKKTAYNFSTDKGVFNDRFVLRYTNKTFGNSDFEMQDNRVLISNKNKEIKIHSSAGIINKIVVYDLLGRSLYEKEDINNTSFKIPNLMVNQHVLLVKVMFQDGQMVSKKIVY
ncbi:T9SS sorting signal type C domain-containing protein [Flavobacterium sp. K5-23]|uniref:T9SS sorting signal type C domain-containing protein n=1 Tax=Flavobacterium sp. K5-23 TaxID=2746225 RepID=UPI00200CBDE5|nr:T9SS sorting signal type C domain-containing protein [Flavobacterium sp. K5-23]UQD55726.1 T9SS sorting signal type C domain-containing protein [Flavobacterium sp. K5-23]